MTPEQEDLLLIVARIVLNMLREQPPPEPVEPDEYARECTRLLGELRSFDQSNNEPSAK